MATRAYICYQTWDGNIKGVYNHWDGSIKELGYKIVDVATKKFIDNRGVFGIQNSATVEQALEAFIQAYILGHPGGWSEFDEVCYCHSPHFLLRDGYHEQICEGDECFCEEYTYVIIPHKQKMEVYTWDNMVARYDFNKRKWKFFVKEEVL